jgi:hypothetical protein
MNARKDKKAAAKNATAPKIEEKALKASKKEKEAAKMEKAVQAAVIHEEKPAPAKKATKVVEATAVVSGKTEKQVNQRVQDLLWFSKIAGKYDPVAIRTRFTEWCAKNAVAPTLREMGLQKLETSKCGDSVIGKNAKITKTVEAVKVEAKPKKGGKALKTATATA